MDTDRNPDVAVARSRARIYWLCQFGGWGLYTAYVLTFTLHYEGVRLRPIVSVVGFLFVVCPLVCHGLRRWMRTHGWLTMPVARVLPRLAAVVLALSAVLTALTGAFNIAVEPALRWRDWWPAPLAGVFSGYVIAFAVWLRIYFSVQRARERRALQMKALQLEVVAQQAQLRTLESQLNPHFLFNCLNSLRALVLEDPARAQAMITRLSDVLRYTLRSDDTDAIPLDDEIRAVEDYLTLERVRFEQRLTYVIDVAPDARRQRVPRMLLLTLVENAVKHGIGRLTRGGRIAITADVEGNRLTLRVNNSGAIRPDSGAGVGLRNARERLRLLYGDAATLTLEPSGGEVVARVSIPLTAPVEAGVPA